MPIRNRFGCNEVVLEHALTLIGDGRRRNPIPSRIYAIVINTARLSSLLIRRGDLVIGYNPQVRCQHSAGIANRVILMNC